MKKVISALLIMFILISAVACSDKSKTSAQGGQENTMKSDEINIDAMSEDELNNLVQMINKRIPQNAEKAASIDQIDLDAMSAADLEKLYVEVDGRINPEGSNSDTNSEPNNGGYQPSKDEIVYENSIWGFDFKLPGSWNGFYVVLDEWQGNFIGDNANSDEVVKGPKLLIRHPLWNIDKERADIPIMIFTKDQWQNVISEKMAVSAAPIPPSGLGENSKYVFALPARYSFYELDGMEEVVNIAEGKPLTPTEIFN